MTSVLVTPEPPRLHPVLASRVSTRAFSDAPLSRTEVESLLEAVRWSPSAFNAQPWRVHYATRDDDPEGHALLADLLFDGNAWARRAPFLAVLTTRSTFGPESRRHGDANPWSEYDAGAAGFALTVQATALGLASHQMGGFDADAARRVLDLPDEETPLTMIAIARPGPLEELPEPWRSREGAPRERKPLDEVARRVSGRKT